MSSEPTQTLAEVADELEELSNALSLIVNDINKVLRKRDEVKTDNYLNGLEWQLELLFRVSTHIVTNAIHKASATLRE